MTKIPLTSDQVIDHLEEIFEVLNRYNQSTDILMYGSSLVLNISTPPGNINMAMTIIKEIGVKDAHAIVDDEYAAIIKLSLP